MDAATASGRPSAARVRRLGQEHARRCTLRAQGVEGRTRRDPEIARRLRGEDAMNLAITRALAHFVWEGALIGVLAAAILRTRRSARVRYGVAAVGLLAMA